MSNNESDYFDQAQPFSGLTSSSSSYASEPYSEGSFVPSSAHSYLDGPYSEGDQADLPSSHAHYGIGSEFDGLGGANFFDDVLSGAIQFSSPTYVEDPRWGDVGVPSQMGTSGYESAPPAPPQVWDRSQTGDIAGSSFMSYNDSQTSSVPSMPSPMATIQSYSAYGPTAPDTSESHVIPSQTSLLSPTIGQPYSGMVPSSESTAPSSNARMTLPPSGIPPTIDPRRRSMTPPVQSPVKQVKGGRTVRNNPRKGQGRSRAKSPSYRYGSSGQASTSSKRISSKFLGSSSKGKRKAVVSDISDSDSDSSGSGDDDGGNGDSGNGSGCGKKNQDGFTADVPPDFRERLDSWAENHANDGWQEIFLNIVTHLHEIIMKFFFLDWDDGFYTMVIEAAVGVYKEKHPGCDDPMQILNEDGQNELIHIMRALTIYLRRTDKLKTLPIIFRPRTRRRQGNGGTEKKSRSRKKNPPAANYDIIQYPENEDDINHNREVVAHLLRTGLHPFAHKVEKDAIVGNFTNPVLLRIIRTLSFTTNNKDINPIPIGASWSDQVPGYVVPYAASLAYHCISFYRAGECKEFPLDRTHHSDVFEKVRQSYMNVQNDEAMHAALTTIFSDATSYGPKPLETFAVKM